MVETLGGWETVRRMGHYEGRQEGIQEGRQEGIQEGRQEGIQEGRQEGIEKVAANLLQDGMDSEKVVEVTNLSRSRVESLWQKMNGGSKTLSRKIVRFVFGRCKPVGGGFHWLDHYPIWRGIALVFSVCAKAAKALGKTMPTMSCKT